MLSVADLDEARAGLAGVISPTPSRHSNSLSARHGRPVWYKPEFRQRTGSFKIRGAYHLMSSLPPTAHVVAGSAGNHAQGVALAASLLGQRATIVMPVGASLPKLAATRGYGAEIVEEGTTVDDAVARARTLAEHTGATFVPPFDDEAVIAGQSTIGLEVLDEVPDLSTVVVPVGGGGLLAGVACAVKLHRPDVRVVGVSAAGADSMGASLAAGHVVSVAPDTVADGIALRAPSELTLAYTTRFVDDVVAVSDEQITAAMLELVERTKSVVEPAGAVALAAIAADLVGGGSGPVVALLSGGNVDPVLFTKCLHHGLNAAGRYLYLGVVLDDQPGALAAFTAALAAARLNVLEVDHQRSGLNLELDSVQVTALVETRDRAHGERILADLRAAGFEVHAAR